MCRSIVSRFRKSRISSPTTDSALLGFEHDADVLLRYRVQFPDDPACTDLDHWHDYEQQNPHTFARMYQFIVQKQA